MSACRWQCKEPGAVRALACKSRTHPCGRAGNTRLRLTRETPTGEYADEAASSAMSNIATRRAIAVDEARLMTAAGRKSADIIRRRRDKMS